MSDQLTSQSRSNASGITRRTALRGAAWSASAVTVVVAAPAHANTSNVTPKGEAKGKVTRSGNSGAVFTFDTKFKNTGTTAIPTVTCVISWNGFSQSVTASPVAASASVSLPSSPVSFPNNAQGLTVTLTYYAGGTGSTPLCTLTFPDVQKGSTVTGL